MLLPLQGASIGAVGVTQGVASLALGYVLHWAFSPPFKHVTASATSAYQPISISTHNPRRQPLCSCGHADVSPWPSAAQRPYVLMLLCPYVSRVSGSHATLRRQPLCFLCSLCSYVSAVSAKKNNVTSTSPIYSACFGIFTAMASIMRRYTPLSSSMRFASWRVSSLICSIVPTCLLML